MAFSKHVLDLDAEAEAERISAFIRRHVLEFYRRKGAVVGLSGGVDSALVAALCVRAFGPERVLGVVLPERESSPVSETYAREQAEALGIACERVDLTPILSTLGVYETKERVIGRLCPGFDPATDVTKIGLPGRLLEREGLNVFSLTVRKPDGREVSRRLGADDFREISASQNMKQRSRMTQLYRFAESRHYVVAGTTNRAELEQGFFVKYGDGGVDLEPVAHLYKMQVFALARHTGVVANILAREPSPDTWSAGVGDVEFYFRMPFEVLDLLLYAIDHGAAPPDVARELGLEPEQVARAYRDITSKRKATWHLRSLPPSLPL
ncbi:MAG: NAD(+) synthase [Planctomycetota bacterium]|jgi:NAD+ synthase